MTRRFNWKRLARSGAFVGAAAAGIVACEGWEIWDEIFNRSTYGWMSGDGGSTVVIPGPNGTKRLLWTFGDTLGNPLTYTYPLQPTPVFAFGNTLAVHAIGSPADTPPTPLNNTDPNSPTGTRFYGRSGTTPFGAIDITWGGMTDTQQYFRLKTCTGGTVPNQQLTWPGDGVHVNGSELAYFTWWLPVVEPPGEESRIYFRQNVIQRFTNVTSTSTPLQWQCSTSGVTHPPEQYPSFPPSDAELAQDPELVWGVAVLRQGGRSYIYGTRRQPSVGDANIPDLVAARADDSDIFDARKWVYRYKANTWIQNLDGTVGRCGSTPCWLGDGLPSPVGSPVVDGYPYTVALRDQLYAQAVDVAPELSVDRVTHSETGPYGTVNGTAYVLVHGAWTPLMDSFGNDATPTAPHLQDDLANNYRAIVMRTRSTVETWSGPDSGNVTRRPDGTVDGSTAKADIIAKSTNWPGIGPLNPVDKKVISGYNAYRSIHAVKGHAEISPAGSVLVSYYVWLHWICADGACDEAFADTTPVLAYSMQESQNHEYVSPFRTTQIPLRVVDPWCHAHFSGQCQVE